MASDSSSQPTSAPLRSTTPDLGSQLKRLERVIIDRVDEGQTHFKSRRLSKHVPENTRWVGQALPMLDEHSERLEFERWGGSDNIVWNVQLKR